MNSTMPNGTVLAYATDAGGNMIGRDGQITTNLDDAVLGQIGWVESDPDSDVDNVMSAGIQSVYLRSVSSSTSRFRLVTTSSSCCRTCKSECTSLSPPTAR